MKKRIKKLLVTSLLSTLTLAVTASIIASCAKKEVEKEPEPTIEDKAKKIYDVINNTKIETSPINSSIFVSLYNDNYNTKDKDLDLSSLESTQLISNLSLLYPEISKFDNTGITIFVSEKLDNIDYNNYTNYQKVRLGLRYLDKKYILNFELIIKEGNDINSLDELKNLSNLFYDKSTVAGNATAFITAYNNNYNKLGAGNTLSDTAKNTLLSSYMAFYKWSNEIAVFDNVYLYVLQNTTAIQSNVSEETKFTLNIGMKLKSNPDIKVEKSFILTVIPEEAISTKVAFFEGPSIVQTETGVRGLIKKNYTNLEQKKSNTLDPNILPKSKDEAIRNNSEYWLDVSTWNLQLKDENNSLSANITFKPGTVKMATIDTSKSTEVRTNISITINNFLGLGIIKIDDIYINNQIVSEDNIYNEEDPGSNTEESKIVLAGYKLDTLTNKIIPAPKTITIDGFGINSAKTELEYTINPSLDASEEDRVKNFLYLQQHYFSGTKFDGDNKFENKTIVIPKGIYQSGSTDINLEKPGLMIGSKNIKFIMQPGVIFTSKGKSGALNAQQTIRLTKDSENIEVYGGSFYGRTGETKKGILVEGNNISFYDGYFDGRPYEKRNDDLSIYESFYVDGTNGINKFKVYNSYITNGMITFANGVGKKGEVTSQEQDLLFEKNTIIYSPLRLNGRDINIGWRTKDVFVKPYFKNNLLGLYYDPFNIENKYFYLSYTKEVGGEDNFNIDEYFDKGGNKFADPEPWYIEDKIRPALSDQTILKVQRNSTATSENINELYKIIDVVQFKNSDNDELLAWNTNSSATTTQWAGYIEGAKSNDEGWGDENNLEFYNDETALEKYTGNISDLANGEIKYARFKKYAQVVYFW